jgi:uncharacterized MnhB-related membrane protein
MSMTPIGPFILLSAGMVISGFQAVRAPRLVLSAVWLAAVSALVSIFFYLLGAPEVAVIELSVGAGLVTVLFLFAIGIAGEEAIGSRTRLPPVIVWVLVLAPLALAGWLILPVAAPAEVGLRSDLQQTLWRDRWADVVIQVALIFAGVLGLLGLLAEARPTLEQPLAREMAAQRQRDLASLEDQSTDKEKRTLLGVRPE